MIKMNNEELMKVEGGAISYGVAVGIGAGIIFLIGLVDGFMRPYRCR